MNRANGMDYTREERIQFCLRDAEQYEAKARGTIDTDEKAHFLMLADGARKMAAMIRQESSR